MNVARLTAATPLRRSAAACAVVAVLYVAGAWLGLPFAFTKTNATALWPPSGIALAAMILLGPRSLPGVWLGAFAANASFLHSHGQLSWALSYGLGAVAASGNAVEALAGWYLCERWLKPRWLGSDGRLAAQRVSALEFAAMAGLTSLAGALFGPAAVCAAGLAPWTDWPMIWLTWFTGDATGILIVTPFVLSFFAPDTLPAGRRRPLEALAALSVLAALAAMSFGEWVRLEGRRVPLAFFTSGPLIWIALRLDPRTMARALVLFAVISAWYTVSGLGLFAFRNQSASLLLLILYYWAQFMGAMPLALEVAARKEAQEELARANEARLAARLRQQTTVAELGLEALRGGGPRALLSSAVSRVASTLEVELCGVYELMPDADTLVLRAAHGWPAGEEGRAVVPWDPAAEAPQPRSLGAVSGAGVVIFGQDERPYGLLCAHSRRPRAFDSDDRAFLQAAANVIAMAVQRQDLENEVQESSDNERSRIAYDLHDGLGQELAGLSYMATALASDLAKAGSPYASEADKAAAQLRECVRHTRVIVRGLCPVNLAEGGLAAALAELCRATEEMTSIVCRFEHSPGAEIDDPFTAGHLFRIAQESVQNAVKHSGASRITARLGVEDGRVSLTVEDDGIGLAGDGPRGGFGLRIMKHRARIINASLAVESRPAGGTAMRCLTSSPARSAPAAGPLLS